MATESPDARLRELEAIARIASRFTFEEPLEHIMGGVAEEVVFASGSALACIIAEAHRETRLLSRVVGSSGLPEGFQEVLQEAWRVAGSPVVSSSIGSRSTQVFELAGMVRTPGYERVRAEQAAAGWAILAAVPMVYRGEAVGLFLVFYPPGGPPGSAEMSFLEATSDQAAVGMENARLFAQAQAAAVLRERQRMSRELHDSVSQALYGISLGAQTAIELRSADPSRAAEALDYVLELADAGLAEMRALLFELRPESLEMDGLVAALARQVAVLQKRHHVHVDAAFCVEPDIENSAKEMFYRVAQEALQNVVKHATASQVSIRLWQGTSAVGLEILDDGRGFNLASSYPGHLGITGMGERARREGAELSVRSEPGSGCCVTLLLPLQERPH